jgi:hypothetical protein
MLALQTGGKSPANCALDSVFSQQFSGCLACLTTRGGPKNGTYGYIQKYIEQYYQFGIDFCDGQSAEPIFVTPSSTVLIARATADGASSTTTLLQSNTASPTVGSNSPVTSSSADSSARGPSSTVATTTYDYGFWVQYTFIICPSRTNTPGQLVTPQGKFPDCHCFDLFSL